MCWLILYLLIGWSFVEISAWNERRLGGGNLPIGAVLWILLAWPLVTLAAIWQIWRG